MGYKIEQICIIMSYVPNGGLDIPNINIFMNAIKAGWVNGS